MESASAGRYGFSYLNKGYGMTDGSAAYDLSRFDRRKRVRQAVLEDVQEQTLAQPKVRPQERVRAKSAVRARRVSFLSVFGFLTIMAMALMIVYSYVQIAELSDDIYFSKQEMTRLESEKATLTKDYEQKIDLKNIEKIATEKLGMIKPQAEQINYIDLSGKDFVTVVVPESENGSVFMTALSESFGSLLEYIR